MSLKPALRIIDLSRAEPKGPVEAKVIVVPLPKKTVGVIFGQRTADYLQRFNTYVLDGNLLLGDPQAVWDAPTSNARFAITAIKPPGFDKDPHVLSVGPFDEDSYIAIYSSHKPPNSGTYKPNDPKFTYEEFKIGGKNAINFTMINSEDGGDSDYHDTVVGVAVNYLYK